MNPTQRLEWAKEMLAENLGAQRSAAWSSIREAYADGEASWRREVRLAARAVRREARLDAQKGGAR